MLDAWRSSGVALPAHRLAPEGGWESQQGAAMRFSELEGKEVIDIAEGVRLGPCGQADLLVDAETGRIEALLIPYRRRWRGREELEIPWSDVRKVGRDVLIVDLSRQRARASAP